MNLRRRQSVALSCAMKARSLLEWAVLFSLLVAVERTQGGKHVVHGDGTLQPGRLAKRRLAFDRYLVRRPGNNRALDLRLEVGMSGDIEGKTGDGLDRMATEMAEFSRILNRLERE
jgi:hypothetical protein